MVAMVAMVAMVGSFACQAGPDDAGPIRGQADTPLARLTAEQYANTIHDLFPDADLELGQLGFPEPVAAVGGFENNASFNAATGPLVEAYARAATTVAEGLSVDALGLDCDFELESCAHPYLLDLAERAWRRPLEGEEAERVVADYEAWAQEYGAELGLQLSVSALLQSPDFIYLPRFGDPEASTSGSGDGVPLGAWELAARMSYLLWNSTPDATLVELARQDALTQTEVLASEARRMLADPRAEAAVVSLHRQLFDLDELSPLDTDYYSERFDGADSNFYYLDYLPQVRYEPELFVIEQVFEGEGTLAALLQSNRAWVTPDTARIAYGVEIPADAPSKVYATPSILHWRPQERTYYRVELDPSERAGLFTLAGFLSAKAGPRQPSPVRRGLTLIERLECLELTLPGDVPILETDPSEAPTTNRERYALHTSVPTCQSCHAQIDGLGFTFENYDALGAWRELDNGHVVDASGEILGTDVDGPVDGAVELMQRLAHSRTIHDCYVRQVYRYAFGRSEEAGDVDALAELSEAFWASGGDIQQLLVDIVTRPEFRHLAPPPAPVPTP